MPKIYEYRGVNGLVYAPIISDTKEEIVFGAVKELAGVAEISKSTESTNEPHYYDNIPAVIISSTGADEITINASAIPLDVLSDITGQYYDTTTGMFVEQERTPKYFALGYQTQTTDGTNMYVWRLKGSFNIPGQTNATVNDGTDANGQELTYTGIGTIHKFTKTGMSAKAITVDTSVNAVTEADFFDSVQTPDTITEASTVSGILVNPTTVNLTVGGTQTVEATLTPNGARGTITWNTSDSSVATVDQTGIVTAVGPGTATITATCLEYTATADVTVAAATVAVTGVTLDESTATVNVGETVTLTATVAPENATNTNVTWSSDEETVATVEDGVVTGVSAGTATITVTTEDGNFTDTCEVTVS